MKPIYCSVPQFLCVEEKVFSQVYYVKDMQIFQPVTFPWLRRPPPPSHSLNSVFTYFMPTGSQHPSSDSHVSSLQKEEKLLWHRFGAGREGVEEQMGLLGA